MLAPLLPGHACHRRISLPCRVAALVSALEAALEVNQHLNSEVEKQTHKLHDAEHELKGLRLRCHQLSDLVKSERGQAHPEEDPKAAVQSVVRRSVRSVHTRFAAGSGRQQLLLRM